MRAIPLFIFKRPFLFTLVFILVGLISALVAKQIKLDADLAALLPESFESVQDLDRVKERFGGLGYVILAVSGSSPDQMRRFADDASKLIEPLDTVSFVDYRRPVEFYQDRVFYYLEQGDLDYVYKQLKDRWKWEKNKRNPMYIDLENAPAPSLEFKDLEEKYSRNSSSWMAAQHADEPYYFNKDKTLLAIFIKPKQASTNLLFTQQVTQQVHQVLDEMNLTEYGAELKVEFTGGYQKKIDTQKLMQDDLGLVSVVALVLVFGYLLLHFKRLEALVLIVVPLLLGLFATFAFAEIVFGQLNILSAFIGVILLGLGIDHGIHLLSRFIDEQRRGTDLDTSVIRTFSRTGKSVGVAALTTFVTFVGLGFSEFRAFFEFGMIAAAGMILVTFFYLICMPALLGLALRFTWDIKVKINDEKSLGRFSGFIERRSGLLLFSGIAIWAAMSYASNDMRFNYDFESLGNTELRSFKLNAEVNELLGYSQAPMLALTKNRDEERFIAQQLQAGMENPEFRSGLDFVLTSSDLVPDNQDLKQHTLQKIEKLVDKVNPAWVPEDDVESFNNLKRMLKIPPFGFDNLPRETKLLFGTRDGQEPDDGILMLFPAVKQTDGEAVRELARELRAAKQSDGERMVIAGEPMILADILTLVFEESPKVLAFCSIMVFLILWIFLRNHYLALLALVPAIFTLTITFGIMAVFDLELNYINLAMIPVLLGVSVDSGVHMVGRAVDGHDLRSIIGETGMAILGSIVTSGLGLGALLLTGHAGLNSLAQIGTIGLLVNLVVSIFILPSLLSWKPVQRLAIAQAHDDAETQPA
ncbi:MAG: MMPL family transporter [Gammaproteobacteria bacterium]|nr:MMPL family transporter [Gammaproteobacteria bacterium]